MLPPGTLLEVLRAQFAHAPSVLAYYESKCVHGRYCPTPELTRPYGDDPRDWIDD